jgi:hypothetical protein
MSATDTPRVEWPHACRGGVSACSPTGVSLISHAYSGNLHTTRVAEAPSGKLGSPCHPRAHPSTAADTALVTNDHKPPSAAPPANQRARCCKTVSRQAPVADLLESGLRFTTQSTPQHTPTEVAGAPSGMLGSPYRLMAHPSTAADIPYGKSDRTGSPPYPLMA